MQTSDAINELATALAKAQGQIKGAVKDAENPHYRSRYADLASVWDACRAALSANGLSVLQAPRGLVSESGWVVQVETRLLHTSGQWAADTLTLTVPVGKPDAQGIGSALTYARRYALAAFVGVAPEDDDGNAAVGPSNLTYVDTRAGEISDAPKSATNGKPLTISSVRSTETKKPGTVRYTVMFSNGLKAATISDRLGNLAKELFESGDEVLPPVTKATSFGTDLVDIHRKSATTVTRHDDVPDITDADIPF